MDVHFIALGKTDFYSVSSRLPLLVAKVLRKEFMSLLSQPMSLQTLISSENVTASTLGAFGKSLTKMKNKTNPGIVLL
ncbi:hypothetical protein EWB00_005023 [Schistosoma japonicum]|uniref:Uncharacterized protein n=1 Tax=Schistosoma japonicum TaxID=6182 RepID=A0A4Z2D337_SCHJA|nr:hypothetical protein EWB00_005023 [Schistosoma japonicum]